MHTLQYRTIHDTTVGQFVKDFLLKCQMATPDFDNIDKNQLHDELRKNLFEVSYPKSHFSKSFFCFFQNKAKVSEISLGLILKLKNNYRFLVTKQCKS